MGFYTKKLVVNKKRYRCKYIIEDGVQMFCLNDTCRVFSKVEDKDKIIQIITDFKEANDAEITHNGVKEIFYFADKKINTLFSHFAIRVKDCERLVFAMKPLYIHYTEKNGKKYYRLKDFCEEFFADTSKTDQYITLFHSEHNKNDSNSTWANGNYHVPLDRLQFFKDWLITDNVYSTKWKHIFTAEYDTKFETDSIVNQVNESVAEPVAEPTKEVEKKEEDTVSEQFDSSDEDDMPLSSELPKKRKHGNVFTSEGFDDDF